MFVVGWGILGLGGEVGCLEVGWVVLLLFVVVVGVM